MPSKTVRGLFLENEARRSYLHSQHLNRHLVKKLATIGYDVPFTRGHGQYLFSRSGEKYIDLLSGWGVFTIGRNHFGVREALKDLLDAELPNLVQLDLPVLAGLLAKRLLTYTPYLDRVFFTNSGAETVEAAIKLARAATGRNGLVHCGGAFHGLTYGALSLNGQAAYKEGFGPLLANSVEIPFDDLDALDCALQQRSAAAFVVEPIQGAQVSIPSDGYLSGAASLCRKYGTLLVADEIQTGLGRTGRFLAVDHWGVKPDIILLSKGLSGGYVPIGALLTRDWIFERVFERTGRAVAHGSTFSKNDLAMMAGLSTLDAIEDEQLVQRSDRIGSYLLDNLKKVLMPYEVVHSVRGKGLMIAVVFGQPRSLKLRATWSSLEAAKSGLFSLLVTIPLLRDHRILTQASGNLLKLTPPLVLTESDCDAVAKAFGEVIASTERVPAAIWSVGLSIASNVKRLRTLGA